MGESDGISRKQEERETLGKLEKHFKEESRHHPIYINYCNSLNKILHGHSQSEGLSFNEFWGVVYKQLENIKKERPYDFKQIYMTYLEQLSKYWVDNIKRKR